VKIHFAPNKNRLLETWRQVLEAGDASIVETLPTSTGTATSNLQHLSYALLTIHVSKEKPSIRWISSLGTRPPQAIVWRKLPNWKFQLFPPSIWSNVWSTDDDWHRMPMRLFPITIKHKINLIPLFHACWTISTRCFKPMFYCLIKNHFLRLINLFLMVSVECVLFELWIFGIYIFPFHFHLRRLTFSPFSKSFIHIHWESIKKLPKFHPKSFEFKDFNFISKWTVKEFVHSCPGYIRALFPGDRRLAPSSTPVSTKSYYQFCSVYFNFWHFLLHIRTLQHLSFNLRYCMSLKKVK